MNTQSINKNIAAILSSLFLSFTLSACASSPDKSGHELWSDTLTLSWNDFRGGELPDNARMAYMFDFSINGDGNVITCEVKTFMDKNNSQKMKGHRSDYLLQHEISHLKLAEAHARMLRKELSEIKESDFKKAIAKTEQLYKEHIKRDKAVQLQYDTETNHSLEKDKQEEWNNKIDSLLKELADYSDTQVTITLTQQ